MTSSRRSAGDIVSPLNEPLKAIVHSFLIFDSNNETSSSTSLVSSPTDRLDALEIQLRTEILQLCHQVVVADADEKKSACERSLQRFWKDFLNVAHHIVDEIERQSSLESSSYDDAKESEMDETSSSSNPDVFRILEPVKSQLRKIPVLVLEDIVDTLSTSCAYTFWKECVTATPDSLLFSSPIWTPRPSTRPPRPLPPNTKPPPLHPCWLPFLKTTNKFLRRLQEEEYAVQAAEVLILLSTVYPMSEKSATKVWGSHNSNNSAIWENEEEFSQYDDETVATATASVGTNATSTTTKKAEDPHSYSFYETFWRLQQDFRNPNGIVVADFLKRLGIVVQSLQSHSSEPTAVVEQAGGEVSTKSDTMTLPFLTASRLLPIQLSDTSFRTVVLSQFWIVAHHLMSQVPTLSVQLRQLLTVAEQAMPSKQLSALQSVLNGSEQSWRQWKQNKCLPNLEKIQLQAPPRRKRKYATVTMTKQEESEDGYTWGDLKSVSSSMRDSVPATKSHLEDYVEALDPDSGIEAEYHPKNDALFAWQALRLLSSEGMERFGTIKPTGDFEGMVRALYSEDYGITIAGDGPLPCEEDTFAEIQPSPAEESAAPTPSANKKEESPSEKDEVPGDVNPMDVANENGQIEDENPVESADKMSADSNSVHNEAEDKTSKTEELSSSQKPDPSRKEKVVLDEKTPNQREERSQQKVEEFDHFNRRGNDANRFRNRSDQGHDRRDNSRDGNRRDGGYSDHPRRDDRGMHNRGGRGGDRSMERRGDDFRREPYGRGGGGRGDGRGGSGRGDGRSAGGRGDGRGGGGRGDGRDGNGGGRGSRSRR